MPVLIDLEHNVIAGHCRLKAAELLGLHEVPTICLEHLTDAQKRAFMIADNRLTEISRWNDRLLAEQLKRLSELELDFSLEVTGFEMGEIDLRIEGLASMVDESDPADVIPAIAEGNPVSNFGDMWVLDDRHQVLVGNALPADSFTTVMGSDLADMIFVDPPFNVAIEGHAGNFGSVHHREFMMASGEMSDTEYEAFLTQALSSLSRFSAEGSLHYICIDWRHISALLAAGRSNYTELKNLCVWAKQTLSYRVAVRIPIRSD